MVSIAEILAFLDEEGVEYEFRGDRNAKIDGFSSLKNYKAGSFTWVKKQESVPEGFDLSQIALAVITSGVAGDFANAIETRESKRAFFSAIEHFYATDEQRPSIGQFTYISPRVKIGKNVRVGHNCTLDGDITIGDNTVIWNGVTIINRVVIGKNCEIQSGTVIGHDGFAYTEDEAHQKTMVRHFGGVVLGDDVLLGSNVCVCRGTIDDTVIDDGTKIDNMTHVAHNCAIGKRVGMAYPCRLGGSSQIGEAAYLSACVVRNQSKVGKNAFVGMGSVVVKDVPADETVAGVPAKTFKRKTQ